MYTIYADGNILYAPHLSREGCGVFSPKLTVELNKAGSLEFTLPPNNVLYDSVSKLKTIITAFQNGTELFRGRILNDERDFYKQKKTYCEGELAFLLDSRQRPYTYEGTISNLFKQYIENHNARVESTKRFMVGNITVEKAEENITTGNDQYSVTSNEIADQLLNYVGGYLKIRSDGDTRYIDWLSESGGLSSQTIEFGVNLLDISEHITAENVFTVLIPTGASITDSNGNSAGNLNISSVNDGKDYLEDESAIALFGRIEETMSWSDVDDASTLKSLGEEYLKKNIEMAVTLSVKAIDLHLINVDTEQIRVGDWVRVISLPHGLNKNFQCTKIAYDMISPDQTEYTFGVTYTGLTDQQVSSEKTIQSSTTTIQSTVNAVNQATKEVNHIIAHLPTEYVTTAAFETYKNEVDARFDSLPGSGEVTYSEVANNAGGITAIID